MTRPPLARLPSRPGRLPSRHAALLGLLHGPAELLPISSSGHVALIPWLLGWPYVELDPELRKSFEVALHLGTAAALLIGPYTRPRSPGRNGLGAADGAPHPHTATEPDLRRAALLALALAPAAMIGWALERPVQQRLGTPATVAAGLLAGSLAMLAADRRPRLRRCTDAGPADALWLGVAQACAIAPGISRNGATLAAARWRGFARRDANALSRVLALPVIVGAGALKGWRLRQHGLPPELGAPFAVGSVAAAASTLACLPLMSRLDDDRPLAPYAVYRLALAALAVCRLRKNGRR